MDIDKWIKLNNQTAGRDKLARLIQYVCRTMWDVLETTNSTPTVTEKVKTLEYICSTFRKLLRFGKCVDVFYAAFKTIHYEDLVIRVTLTISKLSQSLFLFGDHFLWLARTGLFKNINVKKWAEISNRYWLLSIIMNICRDLYEVLRVVDFHKAGKRAEISKYSKLPTKIQSPRDFSNFTLYSYTIFLGHKQIFLDLLKNLCDIFIPLTYLGYTRIKPKTIGLLGAISSIAGIIPLIDPASKLYPA